MFGRVVVALILIPLIIVMVLKGELTFFGALLCIIGGGLYEFYKMIESKGIKVYEKMGIIIGLLIPIIFYVTHQIPEMRDEKISYMVFSFMIIAFITRQVISGEIKEAVTKISYTIFGIIYVSFMLTHILFMKELENGRLWILAVFIMVWASDSLAYFVGIAIGKHKIAPKISPKKSVEGSIAGLIAPVGAMFLIQYFFFFKGIEIGTLNIIIIGIIVGVFGQIGDFGESLFKREFEIKDSGKILLGHGGILDRFDSMLFVMPLVYYYVKYVIVLKLI